MIDQVYVDSKDAAREQSDEEPQLRTITFDLTAPEQDGANQDLLGKQIRLDDRDFKVIKVNTYGDVSLEETSALKISPLRVQQDTRLSVSKRLILSAEP